METTYIKGSSAHAWESKLRSVHTSVMGDVHSLLTFKISSLKVVSIETLLDLLCPFSLLLPAFLESSQLQRMYPYIVVLIENRLRPTLLMDHAVFYCSANNIKHAKLALVLQNQLRPMFHGTLRSRFRWQRCRFVEPQEPIQELRESAPPLTLMGHNEEVFACSAAVL